MNAIRAFPAVATLLIPVATLRASPALLGAGGTGEWNLFEIVEILGIVTLSLLAATVATGLLRRKNPRVLLKVHKALGFAALACGAAHGALVLYAF
ncbi:MAG TPA: hypothetical protein DCX07_12380 [Phycisphaerales bacterium]|nr:hypothetical protein [Phycisphaerales bacterium]